MGLVRGKSPHASTRGCETTIIPARFGSPGPAGRTTAAAEPPLEPAIAALVDTLYERLIADPDLMSYFDGRDMGRLKAHQRALVTVALGGTSEEYTGRMMQPAHAGMAITQEAFDKVLGHLKAALLDAGVAPATGSRSVVRSRNRKKAIPRTRSCSR